MDNEFLDLIKKFGSNDASSKEVVHSPFNDLITKYGSGSVDAQPLKQSDVVGSNIPRPMSDVEIIASQNQPSKPVEFSQLPIIRQGIKGFSEAGELTHSGFTDIASSKPASGVGKVGLGILQGVGNLTGILPVIEQGTEELTKITGNPEFAKRAELIATSGFPVMKAGQLAATRIMPQPRAINAIIDAVGNELPQVIQRLKENPRLSIIDVSPAARMMAQKLITTEGKHQNQFEQFIKNRIGSAKGAVESIYDDNLGVPVNVLQKVSDLQDAAKKVGKTLINPAVTKAGPVDITSVISHIDDTLKPGVNKIISAGDLLPLGDIEKPLANLRKYLTDDLSNRVDAKNLHQFQSALRAKADNLINSSSGQDRQLGYALMQVRNKIVDAIDRASPQIKNPDGSLSGTYKAALSKFRDEKQIEDAFIKGNLVTRNSKQFEDRPEFWQQWVKENENNPQMLEAAREGARVAIDQQINGFKFGARRGTDIPELEFNKKKLELLFGKEQTDQMFKRLKDERDIAETNTKMINNSQTAMRMKADSRIDLPQKKEAGIGAVLPMLAEITAQLTTGGTLPIAGVATYGTMKGSSALSHSLKTKLAMKKNENIANMLIATGSDRDAVISILENALPKSKQPFLQKAQQTLLPILPP